MSDCSALSVSAATPVTLKGAARVDLSGYMEYFDDLSGKKTLADILNPQNAIAFEPLEGYLNDGYSHKAVWLRFTLLRTAPFSANSCLRLESPYLDYVTAYVQTGSNPDNPSSYTVFRLGDHLPVVERPILARDFRFPLSLPLDVPVTVYVRVQSISSLTCMATVHTVDDIVRYTYLDVMLQCAYLTLIILVALLNLIFFLRIGDRLFLYFSLYAFAVFLNYLSISGILGLILPDIIHLFADYLADLGKGGGILLFSLFLKQLFAAEITMFSKRFLEFMAVMGVLTFLADPFGFYIEIAPVLSISVLIMFFVVTWLSIKAVRNNKPGSIFFFAAFGVSNLGYFLHFLKLLGWVPVGWWNINNIQFASLLNILLMTLALTERLREMEQRATAALRESELKEFELTMERRVTERKQRFLSMLSHEYRTPLAIIRSSIDIMELQKRDQPLSTMAELDKMKRAVGRLVDIMEVSLTQSRLSDAAEREERSLILVAPFLSEELTHIRALWPHRTFTFSRALTDHKIYAEVHYLKIVLFNLLDNAQKYSPTDSSIDIACYAEGSEVVITIGNQAVGHVSDDMQQLFQKYYRGGNSNNISGSGLGLWLVREIVERHHGRITLERCVNDVFVTVFLPVAVLKV